MLWLKTLETYRYKGYLRYLKSVPGKVQHNHDKLKYPESFQHHKLGMAAQWHVTL